ncbi:MAG: hypothetical protein ACOY3I_03840 [Verrucomicrobiota bacterium]
MIETTKNALKNEKNISSDISSAPVTLRDKLRLLREERITAPIASVLGLSGHIALMGSAAAAESQSFFRGLAAIFYLSSHFGNLLHPAIRRWFSESLKNQNHLLAKIINDYIRYPFKYFGILGGVGGVLQIISGILKKQPTEIAMASCATVGNFVLAFHFSNPQNAVQRFINKHSFKVTGVVFNIGSLCAIANGWIYKDLFMLTAGFLYTACNIVIGITKRKHAI